jgi:transcriptional regulator with XRE-family HTH domain
MIMNDIRIICGRNIARLRKERGFNQYDLAAEVGLSKTTIANYEQYISLPGAKNLMAIAEALKVKPYKLLMENGD